MVSINIRLDWLEAVSKLPQSDNNASHMKKGAIHFDLFVLSNEQSSEVSVPGKSAFDFPSAAISSKLSPVLGFGLDAISPMRTDQVDASVFQPFSQGIGIGGAVVDQPRRFFPGSSASLSRDRNRVERFLDESDLVGRGGVQVNSQRNTLAVDHHHPLRTFAAFGFADACAPFFAGANEPSAKVSSQSSRPKASSSPRNFRQMSSQIPFSSQACRRRQQVLGEGKSSGKSFHLAPLRSTQRMPSMHARLSQGRRPPRGECLALGSRGSIFSHCASLSSILVMANPFAGQVNHKTIKGANLHATRF
jgi:hypothetical protein